MTTQALMLCQWVDLNQWVISMKTAVDSMINIIKLCQLVFWIVESKMELLCIKILWGLEKDEFWVVDKINNQWYKYQTQLRKLRYSWKTEESLIRLLRRNLNPRRCVSKTNHIPFNTSPMQINATEDIEPEAISHLSWSPYTKVLLVDLQAWVAQWAKATT